MLRRTKHKIRRCQATLATLRLLDGLRAARVLDAPCGEGLLARELVRAGHEVWACDIDPAALTSRDGLRFDVVDLNRPLPYPNGFFNAVVSLEGVEHLEAPAICLSEFGRVLCPGGHLILTTPNVNNVQSRLHYFLAGRFSGFRSLTRRSAKGLLQQGHWHVTVPYLPTLAFLMNHARLRVTTVEVTMIKTKQWLLLPLALPMWLAGRRAPATSLARLLGSWELLLGRSVIVDAVKES